jgi:hypothetical protein
MLFSFELLCWSILLHHLLAVGPAWSPFTKGLFG